ncbi:SET domain-containing protein [Fomes fomentarius]|nr:SET domain-containing protein [Fomes fomentarius]
MLWFIRTFPETLDGFSRHDQPGQIMNDTFIIADVPGKGKGLVAARQLRRGDLILAESHLFAQKTGYTLTTIVTALSQLSKEEQRAYFSLSNAYPEASPPLGVWVTNSFPCWSPEDPTGENAGTAGVFLTASRFNGSCHPNVYHHLDPESHQMVFRAVTDIAAGEELCITYCNILATRHERQAELKESFRFECCCIACSRTGQEVRRSDDHRTRLARLFHELPDCKHDPVLGLRKVNFALQLLKREGLFECAAEAFYADGLMFCAMVSDVKNAKLWAKKLLEFHVALAGPDSQVTKRTQAYLDDPRGAPLFGTAKNATLAPPEF